MGQHLDSFRADELLSELARRGIIDWRDFLIAGGVDPLEAEHRDLVTWTIHDRIVIVVSEPQ